MGNIASTVTQPTGRTFFSFLRRNADELYWDAAADAFAVVNLNTANEATREPFRITYVEDPATTYAWTVDATAFLDGSYTYTSHELIGVVEFASFLTSTVHITNGTVDQGLLTAELAATAGKTLFSYVKRNSDGLYYDPTDEAFELFNINTAPEVERDTFRVDFDEDPAGTYKWNIDVTNFADGTYSISTRELSGVLEILAAADYSVIVASGAVAAGVALGEIGIDHHTQATDNFRYVTDGGDAITGAVIRVYTKADWDAGNYANVKGVTYTKTDGRWESPVFVDLGATYTLVFAKIGSFGPDTAEVTV